MENKQPLVSVCCTTYNQEAYIRRCLDGILMQKTSFPIEILVHDDASTDATATIIREYEQLYPNIIKPIYQVENQYSKGIHISQTFQYPYVLGKYIALCEGDDYWTDPLKLQKQVDFLESHPDYAMCYTQCVYFYQNRSVFAGRPWGGTGESIDVLLKMNTVPTLTVVMRHDVLMRYLKDIHPELRVWLMGDYPMWLYFAAVSKIHFMAETTGVYRVLSNSASHASSVEKRCQFVDSTLDIQHFFIEQYNVQISERHITEAAVLCKLNIYAKANRKTNFVRLWIQALTKNKFFIFRLKPYLYLGYFFSKRLRERYW